MREIVYVGIYSSGGNLAKCGLGLGTCTNPACNLRNIRFSMQLQ